MKFTSINGYMSSRMWITATLLQLFTQTFCRKYWNRSNDPSGGMTDQMTRAARSVTANIAEGLGRHQTSRETEMRLLDVARASLSELYSDYYFLMLDNAWNLWPPRSEYAQNFDKIKIEAPRYYNDWPTESMQYIKQLSKLFEPWCCHSRNDISINSLMLLIDRLQMMIETKMNSLLDSFKDNGGFTEALTRERLDTRGKKAAEAGAPKCPDCGKPMVKRVTKAGSRQGELFWGCVDYPRCRGIQTIRQ